jgi:Ni/Co efflux regulator RcnB
MKKLILAAVAASVIAAPAAAAPFDRQHNRTQIERVQKTKIVNRNGHKIVKVKQVNSRKWKKGQRFDRRYATNYRVIQSPRQYRLNDAPRGYRWVQSNNDAVLVGITSGLIAAVLANAF